MTEQNNSTAASVAEDAADFQSTRESRCTEQVLSNDRTVSGVTRRRARPRPDAEPAQQDAGRHRARLHDAGACADDHRGQEVFLGRDIAADAGVVQVHFVVRQNLPDVGQNHLGVGQNRFVL